VSVDQQTAECGDYDGSYFHQAKLRLRDHDDGLAVVPGDYLDGARVGEPFVDANGEAGDDLLATGEGERASGTLSPAAMPNVDAGTEEPQRKFKVRSVRAARAAPPIRPGERMVDRPGTRVPLRHRPRSRAGARLAAMAGR